MRGRNGTTHRAETRAGRLKDLVTIDRHAHRLANPHVPERFFAMVDIDDVGSQSRCPPRLETGIALDEIVVLVVLQHGVMDVARPQGSDDRRLVRHDPDGEASEVG